MGEIGVQPDKGTLSAFNQRIFEHIRDYGYCGRSCDTANFYSELVAGNLKKFFPKAQFDVAELDFEFGTGRDLIMPNVSRVLDGDCDEQINVRLTCSTVKTICVPSSKK